MTQRQRIQILGEDAAAGLLEGKGMRLLARNWRCKLGELDIVALDGSTIVFVEVKCRVSDRLYDPALAVDHRKRARIRRLADAFLAIRQPDCSDCRFDVVSVLAGRPVTVKHLIDAF